MQVRLECVMADLSTGTVPQPVIAATAATIARRLPILGSMLSRFIVFGINVPASCGVGFRATPANLLTVRLDLSVEGWQWKYRAGVKAEPCEGMGWVCEQKKSPARAGV